jgi:hypothetical protein
LTPPSYCIIYQEGEEASIWPTGTDITTSTLMKESEVISEMYFNSTLTKLMNRDDFGSSSPLPDDAET